MHLRLIALITLAGASESSYDSGSSDEMSVYSRPLSLSGLEEFSDSYEIDSDSDSSIVDALGGLQLQVSRMFKQSGEFKAIVNLLEQSEDHNMVQSIASDLLYAAARSGNKDIVEKLVSLGAKIGLNKLFVGDPFPPRQLLSRDDLSLDMIQFLMNLGADLEIKTTVRGDTTLMTCVRKQSHLSLMKLLIEKGANVNARNKSQQTALSLACKISVIDKSFERVKLLIDAGSDMDATDNKGGSCMATAIKHYGLIPELMEILLHGGANPCIRSLSYELVSKMPEALAIRLNRQCRTIAAATKVASMMYSESGFSNSIEPLNDLPEDWRSHAITLAGVKHLKSQLTGPQDTRSIAEIPSELVALIDLLGSRPSAIMGLASHLAVFGKTDGYIYNAIVKLSENLNRDQLVDLARVVSNTVEYTRLGCPVSESTVGRLVRNSIDKIWACDPAEVLKKLKRGFYYHLFLKNNFRREASFALNRIEEYLFGKDGLVGGLEAILDSFTITQRDMLLKRRLYAPILGEDRRIRARQEPEDGA